MKDWEKNLETIFIELDRRKIAILKRLIVSVVEKELTEFAESLRKYATEHHTGILIYLEDIDTELKKRLGK